MKNYWLAWIFSFVLTVIAAFSAQSLYPVPCMIRLELAPDAETMSRYLLSIESTAEDSYHILFMNTLVDYVFLSGYTLLTFFSFKILMDVFDSSAGAWVFLFSGLTGFFDILENSFLINSALRHQEDFSYLYYYIVRIKWAFAIIPLMIISVALLYGLLLLLMSIGHRGIKSKEG